MSKKDFIKELESRRPVVEVNPGTIWLKSYDEYLKLTEAYKGKLVKPIHAAKMLGVSRAMIFQLENTGKIRAYRLSFTDDVWKDVPNHLKLLITRSDVYIWVPLEDLEKYAKERGRELKDVRKYYINEFFG